MAAECFHGVNVKLIKTGAKVVRSGRTTTFQMAEAAVSRETEKGRHTTTTARLLPLSCGGWVVDTQAMDVMGSPYVLAHGLGEPVARARTAPAPMTTLSS